ncbi:hypothetical protein GLW07_19125 [Bacillus hwajinpoensis]|uniref:Uncharacterized protein n=1 Tax=Guptibacillus hwajinpoensis TaxID=208199 RepID=A0A845F494_9BACL|nr:MULTISPECIES: hypothetical protein [Bacillaceae]MYL65475.1 hypothetical protein [Pseudalkalibacillus hwajinpoensis]
MKLKELAHSEWRFSVMVLGALLGTFIGISFGRHELNPTFAIGYLAVWVLVVVINAIYVLYKRSKNRGT